jgi:hypothetical protein
LGRGEAARRKGIAESFISLTRIGGERRTTDEDQDELGKSGVFIDGFSLLLGYFLVILN